MSNPKKPSLSLFVSPSSPPIPSSETLLPIASTSNLDAPSNSLGRSTPSNSSPDYSPNHLSTSNSSTSYLNSNSFNSNSNSNDNLSSSMATTSSKDKRITSWGSAVSDSFSFKSNNNLNFLLQEDNNMSSLPSPQVGAQIHSSNSNGWNGMSSTSSLFSLGSQASEGVIDSAGFKPRGNSIFSELRESQSGSQNNLSGGGAGGSRSTGGSFSSTSTSNSQALAAGGIGRKSRETSITSEDLPQSSLTRYPSTNTNASGVSRTASGSAGRSKTLSFFDDPSFGTGGNSIVPPKNPLSRANSSRSIVSSSGNGNDSTGMRITSGSWLERNDDPDRPPVLARRISDSPGHSPTLTSSSNFVHSLPTLPNLPPSLIPFDIPSNPFKKPPPNLSLLNTSTNTRSPTLNSATSTTPNSQSSTPTSDHMSILPTAVSPPRGYNNRFNSSKAPTPNSLSTSQTTTPTLTSFSPIPSIHSTSYQPHHRSNQSNSSFSIPNSTAPFAPPIQLSTLNASWMELDSPPIASSSNLPPIYNSLQSVMLPSPSANATTFDSNVSGQRIGGDQGGLDLEEEGEEGVEDKEPSEGDLIGIWKVVKLLGKGSFSRVALAKGKMKELINGEKEVEVEKDVALKLILRKSYDGNERMRISVVREVEVLKHIHHPSLTTLLSSFSTPLYTVLVLDYSSGGELFDFLAEWHSELNEREELARRIFGELCDAVGWMHEIGLVHRDIKLENILLTSRPFPNNLPPTTSILSILPTPFIKLTDFGLSRFIPLPPPLPPSSTAPSISTQTHPSQLLSTRCGSESYAAPELIMGKKYDGRQTDAWALGVVLFAIGSGEMPFVEVDVIGSENGAEGGGRSKGRKEFLVRIAKGEFKWPDSIPATSPSSTSSFTTPTTTTNNKFKLLTPNFKSLVSKFLTRDPNRRLPVKEVWNHPWFKKAESEGGGMRDGTPVRVMGWVGGRS